MSSVVPDGLAAPIHVSIGGFLQSANAIRVLAIAREIDQDLFDALGPPQVAPVPGGLHATYELLATVGVLSFPLGILSSYVASLLHDFLHGKSTEEKRLEIVIVRKEVRVFLFVDKDAAREEIEGELKRMFEQVGFEDGA